MKRWLISPLGYILGLVLVAQFFPVKASQQALQSKVSFCKLDNPQPFEGKAGLLDSIRIIRIDNLNLSDATVVYELGWQITNNVGVVTEIKNPNGQIQTWRWNDASFAAESMAAPTANLSRGMDLFGLFYKYLSASKSEYSCTPILQNVQ